MLSKKNFLHSKLSRKLINWFDVSYHKLWLFWYMLKVCRAILKRAIVHDMTKYSKDEAPLYEALFFELLTVEYGSKEYDALQGKLRPAKLHHFMHNSHHPEHWADGISDMSPLDQIEMLCDWAAAVRGHKDGSFITSFVLNLDKRYPVPTNTRKVLETNAREIGLLK